MSLRCAGGCCVPSHEVSVAFQITALGFVVGLGLSAIVLEFHRACGFHITDAQNRNLSTRLGGHLRSVAPIIRHLQVLIVSEPEPQALVALLRTHI